MGSAALATANAAAGTVEWEKVGVALGGSALGQLIVGLIDEVASDPQSRPLMGAAASGLLSTAALSALHQYRLQQRIFGVGSDGESGSEEEEEEGRGSGDDGDGGDAAAKRSRKRLIV